MDIGSLTLLRIGWLVRVVARSSWLGEQLFPQLEKPLCFGAPRITLDLDVVKLVEPLVDFVREASLGPLRPIQSTERAQNA